MAQHWLTQKDIGIVTVDGRRLYSPAAARGKGAARTDTVRMSQQLSWQAEVAASETHVAMSVDATVISSLHLNSIPVRLPRKGSTGFFALVQELRLDFSSTFLCGVEHTQIETTHHSANIAEAHV